MKKFLFFLFVVAAFATKTNAQDTVRTLIHPAKIRNFGIYIAPEFQYGQSNATLNSYAGNSTMIIFNKRYAIGVAGYRSVTDAFSPKGVTPLVMRTAFGGGKIEYTVRPDAAVHVSFPLLIGAGDARVDSANARRGRYDRGNDFDDNETSVNRAQFFVVQPGINVEANLLRNIKLFAGVNYRITSKIGTATTIVPTDALQGFGMSAGVRMGIFDIRKPHFHVRKFGRHKNKK
jgi:hypothetical protein